MSSTANEETIGRRIAELLLRCWDERPPSAEPLALESGRSEAVQLLRKQGASGLLWRRYGDDLAPELRMASRQQVLQARLREQELGRTVELLRAAGFEPLLIKGWAIARLYPVAWQRPYGDLDLCVGTPAMSPALAALANRAQSLVPVELHDHSDQIGDLRYGDLVARSQLVPLGETQIRVPGEEEHLRLLAFHLLKHGGWRPLWLCDLAVAVERRGAGFDWERCFRGRPVLTEWVQVCLLLARELLGANLDGVPLDDSVLPSWAAPELLRTWGRGTGASMQVPVSASGGVLAAVRRSWRNSLQASFELSLPPHGLPRLPIRIVASAARVPAVFGRRARHRKWCVRNIARRVSAA